MSGPFGENAARYWAAGLPVIPLHQRDKMPSLNSWSSFCVVMPSEQQQSDWLANFDRGNMGLPLGPCSGVIGIDVDNDDPRIAELVMEICGDSPWTRVGQKGSVKAFKYSGERTFRIKDVEGNMILECLSQGAQIVLPPSIHPKTQRPYVSDTDLPNVTSGLRRLPENVEILLRQGLINLGFELSTQGHTKVASWTPAGSRDTAMTAFAGIQARGVVKGERTLVEAMNEMETWIGAYTERVAGDDIDVSAARQKVVSFFIRDCTGPGKSAVRPGWEDGLPAEMLSEIRELLGEEGEAWDFSKFQARVLQLVELHKPGSAAYLTGVNEVMTKMVNLSAMEMLEEESILRLIANTSSRSLTVQILKTQIRGLRQGALAGVDHTELAKALITELESSGFVRNWLTKWWQWDGAMWKEMSDADVMRKIAEELGHYPAAKRNSDHNGIMKTASALIGGNIRTKAVEGINFANGYLTSDLKLLPHEDAYGKTYVLPYRYLPEESGRMPRFLQYLWDCWGGEADYDDRVQALRESMAATMFGIGYKFQRAICCYGVPGSGKSVMLDIMQGLMPEGAVCSVKPGDWDDTFLPSQMHGKLMNRAGELSDTKMIPGDMFKLIIEGSEISAQHKHKPIFTFKPTLTHWFGSNHTPKSRDSSRGFTRRWLFHHFTRIVDAGLKNVDLATEILAEEREAIMAWAAQSVSGLIVRGDYVESESHLRVMKDTAVSNNSVRQFLVQSSSLNLARNESVSMSETSIYDVYYGFCVSTTNAKPVNLTNFRARMSEMQGEFGFKIQTKMNTGGYEETFYVGITKVKGK
jgi:hypothetical protein